MLEHLVTTDANVHRQRSVAALQSLFVGDALAMPVHWYYSEHDIEAGFPGGIVQFEAAPAHHPSSIMALHSTNQGGRGRQGGASGRQVVGDVILKGKGQFWGQANQHYHQGMQAGENTLNAHCARVLLRVLAANTGHYHEAQFLDAYIQMMTADSPQHPDTYAESYHRAFFANWAMGKPHNRCAAVTHDTPSIGGLVTIGPLVIGELMAGTALQRVREVALGHLYLTHPDAQLARVCADYVDLIHDLLFREPDQPAQQVLAEFANRAVGGNVEQLIQKTHNDADIIGGRFSKACYISGSWPGVLFLACKYLLDPIAGLRSNTNLGGDNVHRGSVLGFILGLATGDDLPAFFGQLTARQLIDAEINGLLDAVQVRST